jgi:hypothetical protein
LSKREKIKMPLGWVTANGSPAPAGSTPEQTPQSPEAAQNSPVVRPSVDSPPVAPASSTPVPAGNPPTVVPVAGPVQFRQAYVPSGVPRNSGMAQQPPPGNRAQTASGQVQRANQQPRSSNPQASHPPPVAHSASQSARPSRHGR